MPRQSKKIDFDAVREIAKALPEVQDCSTSRGVGLKVGRKLIACTAIHRSAEPSSLMVRIGFDERELLLVTEPDTYYLTEHYRGYPAVLVRLSAIDRTALLALLGSAARFASVRTARRSRS